jgi:cysteinyl-tRNA synthetase
VVDELARARAEARARKDFEASDRLRDEIEAAGWEVRDVDAEPGFQLVPKR